MAKVIKTNPSPLALAGSLFEQIRLAGLGAVTKAQEEGSRLFHSLIEEGATIEARIIGKPAEPQTKPKPQVSPEDVAKLEEIFEDRVARSLKRMRVPTQQDLRKMMTQMDALQKQVKALAEKQKSKTE